MECYGAGADDTRDAGLICFDDVAGRASDRAPGEAVPQTAWHAKPLLTFSDALALGRRALDSCWTEVWSDRSQTDFERLLNVGQQVIRILYPRGIAHQAITNPQPLAFFRRQFVVRHQRRLFH